jgi:hypothetical protein
MHIHLISAVPQYINSVGNKSVINSTKRKRNKDNNIEMNPLQVKDIPVPLMPTTKEAIDIITKLFGCCGDTDACCLVNTNSIDYAISNFLLSRGETYLMNAHERDIFMMDVFRGTASFPEGASKISHEYTIGGDSVCRKVFLEAYGFSDFEWKVLLYICLHR